ncbi:hypothetical protein HGRIS_002790 [Hohenbuehelia grisea]|uniref:Uncharacterized protein n=1 Tax=Hohenbuehelia grisea TaxID=104357 RepID=A0ABR3JLI0_9AGAR
MDNVVLPRLTHLSLSDLDRSVCPILSLRLPALRHLFWRPALKGADSQNNQLILSLPACVSTSSLESLTISGVYLTSPGVQLLPSLQIKSSDSDVQYVRTLKRLTLAVNYDPDWINMNDALQWTANNIKSLVSAPLQRIPAHLELHIAVGLQDSPSRFHDQSGSPEWWGYLDRTLADLQIQRARGGSSSKATTNIIFFQSIYHRGTSQDTHARQDMISYVRRCMPQLDKAGSLRAGFEVDDDPFQPGTFVVSSPTPGQPNILRARN